MVAKKKSRNNSSMQLFNYFNFMQKLTVEGNMSFKLKEIKITFSKRERIDIFFVINWQLIN